MKEPKALHCEGQMERFSLNVDHNGLRNRLSVGACGYVNRAGCALLLPRSQTAQFSAPQREHSSDL